MKGVIVAAGYGTRFLPVTKTVPKELLPVGTKPAIAYIVDEFVSAGIRDIIVVTSRRKKALEDYFDREIELEELFRREGKAERLASIAPPEVRMSFVRQTEMRGTGHALLQVKPLVGSDVCVVAYPDDLVLGARPLALQLAEVHERTGKCVMATVHEPGDVSRYGVVEPGADGVSVRGFVEKPAAGREPSHEISIGRYLYTPDFFDLLEEGWRSHTSGEYFHTYALDRLIAADRVAFSRAEGERLDTGDPAGYFEAILRDAAADPSLRPVLERFARESLGLGDEGRAGRA
ncbi:MAG: UTP--glucose-1-phosphate uridylyltransferase [Rectinemataceae bacterium]